MSRKTEWTFFQRGNVCGQEACEKMLNATSHQGNANQHHSDTTSYPSEYLSLKEHKQKMLTLIWRKWILVYCWWGCKLIQPLWRAVSQKTKNRTNI